MTGRSIATRSYVPFLSDREWLAARYGELTIDQIAAELDCSSGPVREALIRHGIARRPTAAQPVPLAQRFWAKVDKAGDCWLWRGSRRGRGYGAVQIEGRPVGTHRVAYELTYGPIPAGMMVCHTCDTPSCVKPSHLFLGTNADNVHDAERKGRRAYGDRHWLRRAPERSLRGERNGSAKLTVVQVAAMRRAYQAGGVTLRALARRFGVGKSMVSNIINGKSWSHLTTDL